MMVLNSRVLMKMNGQTMLRPFERACVPEELGRLLASAAPGDVKWSTIGSWERRYGGQDLNGKSLCIVRYCGIGDLLLVTALVRYLRERYPRAMICFYTLLHHYSANALLGNPDLDGGGPLALPVGLDAVKQFDYHVFIDGWVENNRERDQENWYDSLFAFCGLTGVSEAFKRPFLWPLPEDWRWAQERGHDLDTPYVVVQTTTSTPIRDYPADLVAQTVEGLLTALPGHRVALGGEVELPALERFKGHPRVWWACGTPNWRQMIPYVYGADGVVTADTGMGHVAAAFPHVPVVSLWGPFSADSRVRYYRNHYPLEHGGKCPHQPCFEHGNALPVKRCREAAGWADGETNCLGMRAIQPREIVEAVSRLVAAGKARHIGLMTVESFKRKYGWAPAGKTDGQYGSELSRNVVHTLALWRQPEGVVEIGIQEGRAANSLLKSLPGIREYVGVDLPPDGKPTLAEQQSEVPKQAGRLAADPRLKVVLRPRGSFECKPDDLPAADFWFIDGDHSAAAVEHDTLLACVRAKPGAVIVWHDFFNGQRHIHVTEVLTRLAPTLRMKIWHVLGSHVAFAVKE